MTVALATLIVSLVLTGATAWLARRGGVFSVEDERSSHQGVVPSGGGLGIVLTWFAITFWLLFEQAPQLWLVGVLPAVAVLAVIGWLDDLRPMAARWRLLVQLAVSLYLLACAWQSGVAVTAPVLFLAGLWLLWVANMYNFMDGSHGMAGMQGVFSGLVLAWLFYQAGNTGLYLVSLVIAVSCMGFLPWNLAPKRIFMGDVGSVPLGFALGALCAWGVAIEAFSLASAILVLSVFMVDAGLTLLRRVIRGERWYTAHRQHLYQQLIAAGWSHGNVLVLYLSLNVLLVLPAIVVTATESGFDWFVALGMIATMVVGWILAVRRLGVTA